MLNGKKLLSIDDPAFGLKAGAVESARTLDPDVLCLFYHNPDIWGPMQDDGGAEAKDIDFGLITESEASLDYVFVTTSVDGDLAALFMFKMENSRCYSIHSALLPQYWGKGVAPACGMSACMWMFEHTGCLKIITLVPDFNSPALAMAMDAGMVIEGINRSSFMKGGVLHDQTRLGFTKEELLCQ